MIASKRIGWLTCFLLFAAAAQAASKTFRVQCNWTFGGQVADKLRWSPWLPPLYADIRTKFGFRFHSQPTIQVKCPLNITLIYDPTQARPGGWMPVKIEVNSLECEGNDYNLESHFGLELPNKLQVGLAEGFGEYTIGSDWYDLPLNVWDLLNFVPKVGSLLAAGGNLNITVEGCKRLPIGDNYEVTFSDENSLAKLSFSISDCISSSKKDELVNKLTNKLYVKINGVISKTLLKKIVGKGVDKFLGYLTAIELNANPSYRVKGGETTVWIGSKIGGTTGVHCATFDAPNQQKEIRVYIPAFTDGASELKLYLAGVDYGMTVSMLLKPKVQVVAWAKYFDAMNRDLFTGCAQTVCQPDEHQISIPLQPAPDLFAFSEHLGAKSASLFWVTPNFPTKARLLMSKGTSIRMNRLAADKLESSYRYSHHIAVTGLTPDTLYAYQAICFDQSGRQYKAPVRTFRTLASSQYKTRSDQSYKDMRISSDVVVTDITAHSAKISWTTPSKSTTEVYFAPTPEYAASGMWAVKVKQGAAGSKVQQGHISGERFFEKYHSLTLSDLQPATTYYFSAVSWWYKNGKCDFKAEKANLHFTTQDAPPARCLLRIKVVEAQTGQPVPQARVNVLEGQRCLFSFFTDSNGLTKSFGLERGKLYSWVVSAAGYHLKTDQLRTYSTSPDDLGVRQAPLTPLPAYPCLVKDNITRAGVSGASVTVTGQGWQCQTNANGAFAFVGRRAAGHYTARIVKTGYFPGSAGFYISPSRRFYGGLVYLKPKKFYAQILVRSRSGGALPASVKVYRIGTAAPVATLAVGVNGAAVFQQTTNLSTPNASYLYRFRATPTNTQYAAAEDTIRMAPGEKYVVALRCPKKDTTAPTVSQMNAQRLSPIKWKLSWETDELALCKVEVFRAQETTPFATIPVGIDQSFEYVFDLTNASGTLREKASRRYRWRIRAADAAANVRTTPIQPLPRDNVAPRIRNLRAALQSVLKWRLTWTTSEPAAGSLQVFVQGQAQPALTIPVAEGTHSADVDLSGARNLPRPPGARRYKAKLVLSDVSGNETSSSLLTLPSDSRPPSLSGVRVLHTGRGRWSVAASANEDVTFVVKIYAGDSDPPLKTLRSAKPGRRLSLTLSLSPAELAQAAYQDLSYEILAADAWGNTKRTRRVALDRGARRPKLRLSIRPRVKIFSAGVPFEFRSSVSPSRGDYVQTWTWILDGKSTQETYPGARAVVKKALRAGKNELVVKVLDRTTQLGDMVRLSLPVQEPPRWSLTLDPPRDTVKPGSRLRLILDGPAGGDAIRRASLSLNGRRIMTIRARGFHRAGQRLRASVSFRAPRQPGRVVMGVDIEYASGLFSHAEKTFAAHGKEDGKTGAPGGGLLHLRRR